MEKYQSMVSLRAAVDCADSVGYEPALSPLKPLKCDLHSFLCLCMFM